MQGQSLVRTGELQALDEQLHPHVLKLSIQPLGACFGCEQDLFSLFR
jgi:hypothetical protein